MKNLFKKIGALLVAAVMVLSMCTAAFAATKNTATITVNNADGATLYYAQVIVADRTTETGWAFVGGADGAIASAYKEAFGVNSDQDAIKAMIPAGSVEANKLGKAQALAANAIASSFEEMSENPKEVTAAGVYLVKAVDTNTNAKVRYTYNIMSAYIGFDEVTIDGTTYEYPSLTDASLTAKRTPIQVDKTVADDDNVTKTGDVLTYTVTTTVPYINPTDTDKTFFVYDELTGAEYTETTTATVTLAGTDVTKAYPITFEKNKFSVDLSKMIDNANSNATKTVIITYKVKVTAVEDVVTNKAKAGHKDGNQYGSKEIKTYEGSITLTKTNTDGEALANAEFEVRKDGATDALTFTKLADGVYKYDPAATNKNVVTKADGTVKIQGLDVGAYTFKEVKAPEGYSVNTTDVSATLAVETDKEGNVIPATAALTATTSMTDTKLSSLPSTGGMGTYLFTIIGVVVMAGAAGAFFISRRKGSEE